MQEWLPDKALNVLEMLSQSPGLNLIKRVWRDQKLALQQRSQFKLTELEDLQR
jgi:hypothetical protein